MKRLVSLPILATLALGLGGCDTSNGGGGHAQVKRVDERAQARARSRRNITGYCRRVHGHREVPAATAPPTHAQMVNAVRGVDAFITRAHEFDDAETYEEQLPAREMLTELAGYLEAQDCLEQLVPRIDRALRMMPLPAPPPEDPVYDEDPTDAYGPR